MTRGQTGDYLEINRANWDARAAAHAASEGYGFASFTDDPDHLSSVVRFDVPRLGDLTGLRGVHLQCHIGTDTVSLARLGARMTGLDFSAASLTEARRLAVLAGAEVEFVEAEVYQAPQVLRPESYDLVFTGIGALCWLPSIARWAKTVSQLLCPGGRLFLREGHPMLWTLEDPRPDGLLVVDNSYVERAEPNVWDDPGTYVATNAVFDANLTHEWNHGLGEIISALLAEGMAITAFEEHDTVPWNALPGMMHEVENGEWQLSDRPCRLPHSYTLQAVKRS